MSSCKDCKCVDICYKYRDICAGRKTYNEYFDDDVTCSDFIDRTRFVELPCKIGDTVYVKMQFGGYAEGKVRDYSYFISCGFCVVVTSEKFCKQNIPFSEFGKTVFLTREEAERALKERENI